MEQLIEEMKKLLASSFSLYLKAHNYHLNVTGPNFGQYHEFFGEFYEEVFGSIDTTAEEIRKLGDYAPGSLSRYSELTVVADETTIPEAGVMFRRLASDNDAVLSVLYSARQMAESVGKAGTLDYLEARISVHEKHAWMLKAFE